MVIEPQYHGGTPFSRLFPRRSPSWSMYDTPRVTFHFCVQGNNLLIILKVLSLSSRNLVRTSGRLVPHDSLECPVCRCLDRDRPLVSLGSVLCRDTRVNPTITECLHSCDRVGVPVPSHEQKPLPDLEVGTPLLLKERSHGRVVYEVRPIQEGNE